MGGLGDPHGDKADKDETVYDVVLLLNHLIRERHDTIADDDESNYAWVDQTFRRIRVTSHHLRVQESPIVVPLPP